LDRTLCGALPSELESFLRDIDERSYRASQVLKWVHRRGVLDPRQMTDIPAELRGRLDTEVPKLGARITDVARSSDGTRKARIALADGAAIETVLIPDDEHGTDQEDEGGDAVGSVPASTPAGREPATGSKLTQCISTQVGCAFQCRFCLSGAGGLVRNLSADEIVGQVHLARETRESGERLTNVVLMGSGEPLANLDETFRAIELLTSPHGVGLSTRKVTVSTIGLPRGIARLGEVFGGSIGLAVSLHGPDDETRARLLPRVGSVPLERVLEALAAYPLPRRRRITIEYVLVRGANDSPRHAAALVRALASIRVKVNLIPFNEHPGSDLETPDVGVVEEFQRVLLGRGIATMLRKKRGADIGAACGQLAARGGGGPFA
jgi:23S rRNA (adenine2503-C2)-methyltransferase